MDHEKMMEKPDHSTIEEARIAELEAELEQERMRLTACGVVALSNTPDSAETARDMHPDYRSASCDDVVRMVDEGMALREQIAGQQARIAELREAIVSVCCDHDERVCIRGSDGDRKVLQDALSCTDDLSALAAHDAEVRAPYVKLLSDQDYEYNRKTNVLIERHASQLVKVRKAALLEAADRIDHDVTYYGTAVAIWLRRMAEGEK